MAPKEESAPAADETTVLEVVRVKKEKSVKLLADEEEKPVVVKPAAKKRKVVKEEKSDEMLPIDEEAMKDPKYTCVCGKELSVSSRKRHEKTAAHALYLLTGEKDT